MGRSLNRPFPRGDQGSGFASGRAGEHVPPLLVLILTSSENPFSRTNRGHSIDGYWLLFAAAVFFALGGYRAWANEHNAFVAEAIRNINPLLRIELVGCFFDVSKVPNKQELQTHVYAYLRVTNLTSLETLIKDGTLVMTVDGTRHKGKGDDVSIKGNAIEHISDFKVGGEVLANDVFGNTLSPFSRLLSVVTSDSPLRRGITKEGFFVFTFVNPIDSNHETPYMMPVTDAVFTLRDSFDGLHDLQMNILNIPQGTLTTTGTAFSKPHN